MNRIIAITLLIFLSSCEKNATELEFEKKVMNEIFIDLVDSIFIDMRTMKIPSLHLEEGISDSLKNEKINRYRLALDKNEKKRIEIKNDTSRIVIAVYDTIETQSVSAGEELIKHNNIEYLFNSKTKKIEYKIDLSKVGKSDKFIFKYYTKFPIGRDIWKTEYPFYLGGIVSFTRIQFDRDRKNGILSAGISYAPLNGVGYVIYIKKNENDKWIIDKIIQTSIS